MSNLGSIHTYRTEVDRTEEIFLSIFSDTQLLMENNITRERIPAG